MVADCVSTSATSLRVLFITEGIKEQAKVSVRNVRRDAIKQLEKEEKDSKITEDDLKKGQKQLDDMTKQHTDKIDQVVRHKSDEIMQ